MDDPGAVPSSSSSAAAAAAATTPRVPAAAPPAAVAPPPLAPQQVPAAAVAAAGAAPQAAAVPRRQIFSVELKPGETTIVSWKKLLKESGQAGTSQPPPAAAAAEPAVAAQLGLPGAAHPAENDPEDPTQPNRFNAVIEKIERLYMGKHSSDEEDLDDVPDDDQYATDDSFIDDAELDEYFEVDNLTTKHNGYFINKGSLELIETSTTANVSTKKRRRKDSSGAHIENNKGAVGDNVSMSNMPGKSSARGAAHEGNKLATSNLGSNGEYYHEGKKTKTSATGVPKRRSSDFATGFDSAAHTMASSKDVSNSPSELKHFEKHKTAAFPPTDFGNKSRASETYDYASAYRDKDPSVQLDFQQKKTCIGENQDLTNKMYHKEKHGMNDFSGMAGSAAVYPTQTMHPITASARGSAGTKPKGTRLERAIRDLQKIVAEIEYRPAIDVNEADPNGQASVKRRLPQEVKQKLAKVARLSANHGKVQEHELMDRLMGIVGHLVQRRTLKRNMKEMVELGLSAKQEKADRFQRVKMEINEMVQTRVAAKAKDGSADDFQIMNDEQRASKGKFVMDTALEDRICDLYDLYVEGMDEDKGPQSRKLYVELAELWPQGCMDNVGIKDAITRSKERKRALYNQQKVKNVRDEERLKRKRLAEAAKLPDGYPVAMQSAVAQQAGQPSIINPVSSYRVTDYGQNQASKCLERVRDTSTSDGNNKTAGEVKKKKRKPESDLLDAQANQRMIPWHHGTEKQKPPRHVDEANTSNTLSTVLCLPSYDQQPS
ncbi:ubinuclein-1 isoform X3 [Brachypodium distachyon]|uniref:ubinuclein-1 isoform X3 n=1 Tax=Brachypodium distachyon TaxID=15368 RepID=UPI00052FE2DD|nr:ubinuclein-1 isoform X3 [Brachypodium distachyon]|eukprot:XP_010232654.1 ubinuclein-1 isoform X3 [Brachypodium distachyon]